MQIFQLNLLRLIPQASLLLVACTMSKQNRTSTSLNWRSHQETVQNLREYEALGYFMYLSDTRKFHSRFFLRQHSPDHYDFRLITPFGSTSVSISVHKNVVQVTDHRGRNYFSNNVEKVIYKISGMLIPLNKMRQWILGLPEACDDFTLDHRNYLNQLIYQRGSLKWVIDYKSYNNEVMPPLPSQLELRQKSTRINIKIDSWTLT